MYIGEYYLPQATDMWKKNTTQQVLLWKAGPGNTLIAVQNAQGGGQKTASVMNHLGTIAHKSAAARYAPIVGVRGFDPVSNSVKESFWIISTEC